MEILLMMAQSINELCQCVVQCVDQCMSQGHDPGDLLMPPFSMNISGPTGSGKTYYIKDLLKLPQFEGSLVHLFYGNDQPLYDEMNLASAHQGLDKLESVLSELNPQDKNVIIIDDLMQEAGQSERVRNMVTRDVHHNKYTVIMVQQNLLLQYKYSRDLAINVRYRVIFYNRMTAKQFNNSVREMDKGKNTLKNMYHAMSQPGHPKPLVIDSLTGNTWYGVVPEEVINLDNKP